MLSLIHISLKLRSGSIAEGNCYLDHYRPVYCLSLIHIYLKAITMTEIEEATIKVVVGTEKKSHVMSDREKKLTAYHEGGHAVVTLSLIHI